MWRNSPPPPNLLRTVVRTRDSGKMAAAHPGNLAIATKLVDKHVWYPQILQAVVGTVPQTEPLSEGVGASGLYRTGLRDPYPPGATDVRLRKAAGAILAPSTMSLSWS